MGLIAFAVFSLVTASPASVDWSKLPALQASDGKSYALADVIAGSKATAIIFFAAKCPIQRAHDERLRQLASELSASGAVFLAVDSEADSSLDRDKHEASARSYPFAIIHDPSGIVADALDAKFATFSVVVDPQGRIQYRGGIDSDKTSLKADAQLWLREAVVKVASGQRPPRIETKAFGCYLRRK